MLGRMREALRVLVEAGIGAEFVHTMMNDGAQSELRGVVVVKLCRCQEGERVLSVES